MGFHGYGCLICAEQKADSTETETERAFEINLPVCWY